MGPEHYHEKQREGSKDCIKRKTDVVLHISSTFFTFTKHVEEGWETVVHQLKNPHG